MLSNLSRENKHWLRSPLCLQRNPGCPDSTWSLRKWVRSFAGLWRLCLVLSHITVPIQRESVEFQLRPKRHCHWCHSGTWSSGRFKGGVAVTGLQNPQVLSKEKLFALSGSQTDRGEGGRGMKNHGRDTQGRAPVRVVREDAPLQGRDTYNVCPAGCRSHRGAGSAEVGLPFSSL